MNGSYDWKVYEDVQPFVAVDELEVVVVEEMGGEEDGQRQVVLEVAGSLNFGGPSLMVRLLLDQEGVEYLATSFAQVKNMLTPCLKEEF